ncbi:endolytic transglycosylase MltG [Limoniibacter endophyticus]|uniref:Endolytic murein transglycosylase n=1 Tax=Limoniibacter endophyticus TaxID=1565040 RepID=A0A8J3DHP0_9HYPH|nr:endolytic transglycosylase MltG [Limoniibacter endophyticus]GHC68801.1 4-amino-4-deoxychorismate lyase [Limoniibacter endophyticus]
MSDNTHGSGDHDKSAPASKPIVPKSANEALRSEAGTPPPLRRKRRSRQSRSQVVIFLNFVMSIIVLVALGFGAAAYWVKWSFEKEGPLQASDTVFIRQGAGVGDIAGTLESRGMIDNALAFRLGVRAYGNEGSMKAGEYEIAGRSSMHDIMELLRSGKQILHTITIPEGWTTQQAMERIAQNEILEGEMPAIVPGEGMIAANTISFSRGKTREQIVEQLVNLQQKTIDEIWERRRDDLPIKDKNEFVTLASIVEKETGHADERTRVAAVFINRLNRKMRLQSDPTIRYGKYGGAVYKEAPTIYQSDIRKPTPYNTYTIDGLPPAPIAIPGRSALEAVANPSVTKDLYFVASGDGRHAFAETLDEHNANVRRWRQIERERGEAAKELPAGATTASPTEGAE